MFKNKNLLRRDKRYIEGRAKIMGVKITPVIARSGNVYKNDEYPSEIKFTAETESKVILDCTLVYPNGETKLLSSVALSGNREITVDLPDLQNIYGVLRLTVTGYDENGYRLGEENIGFSHIRAGKRLGLKKCGSSVHYIYHDNEESRACLDLMTECGFSVMRDDFIWRNSEIEKGKVIIPKNYENMINFAVDRGIDVNLLFLYGNDNYDEGAAPYTDEGRAAYAHYCATVAEYFKGKVNRFEIWNEFNLIGGFNPKSAPPSTYAEMLKVAYTEIKKVNPNAIITAGVTCSPHFYWLRQILDAGAYDYFDEISLHPYCSGPDSTYPDDGQGQAEANTQAYIDIIKEYGEEKPVWLSEIGWTTYVAEGASTREEQAASLARLCALTETGETINLLTMYDFQDDNGDEYNIEAHWGMVENYNCTVPHAAKESYAAVSQLNFMIGGKAVAKREITDKVKNITFGDDTLLLWSLDGERETVIKTENTLDFYDMYGNKKQLIPENGMIKLKTDENPCYLAGGKASVASSVNVPYVNRDMPYTLTLIPELREDGWYLKAKVNAWQNALSGRVRIEIPELDVYGQYSNFKLNMGESHIAEYKVGETDLYRLYDVITDLAFADGVRDTGNEKVSFLQAARRGEESNTFTLTADKHYKKILADTATPENLRADISLSYDDEYFYLDAVVEDETHLQIGTSNILWQDIWDGDNIQFMLQPLYDGNKSITRFSDIGLALTSNTNQSVAWRWRTLSNRSYGIFRSCIFKAERMENATVYKAKIPWTELLPPAVELKDCPAFGFALRVGYANSDPHSLDGYMQLYGGIGSWRTPLSYMPHEFGTLVLK